jgi:hypothetical protein
MSTTTALDLRHSMQPVAVEVLWDIALRDFGLMLAAIALARLSAVYAPERFVPWSTSNRNK